MLQFSIVSVAEQAVLGMTLPNTPKTGFSRRGSNQVYDIIKFLKHFHRDMIDEYMYNICLKPNTSKIKVK